MDIWELDLSVRAYNCLKRAGIDTVEQLKEKSEDELMRVRNLGRRNVEEIREKIGGLNMGEEISIQQAYIEQLIKEELKRANKIHGDKFYTVHDGHGVIREEFEEAGEEIKMIELYINSLWNLTKSKNSKSEDRILYVKEIRRYTINAIKELVQVAAMTDKYELSLKDKD